MTEPEESQDDTAPSEPIVASPTANPARVQVPPEGPAGLPDARVGTPGPGEET